MVFKGAFSVAYTVDAEGMTTYFRKHTYRLLWQDCLEFEIVPVMVNHGTAVWILYCSTKALSKKERDNFFQYHKMTMRTFSISSSVMSRLIRSSLAAFRSGHATISRRKCRCKA